MRSLKLLAILWCCLLLNAVSICGYGQVNIIPNGGFENGGTPACTYRAPETYQIDDWKRTDDDTYEGTFDSFDWFDKSYFLNKVCTSGVYDNTLPPFLSDRFIGFFGTETPETESEGARVVLTKKLEAGKTYILRLKAAFSGRPEGNGTLPSSDPRIRIHFTKYSDNWEDWANPFNIHIRDLVQFHLNKNKPYEWQFFYKAFTVPADKSNEMQNFIVEADKDNPVCYIFVDDVELYEVDPCNLSCRPPMGAVGLDPDARGTAGYLWSGDDKFCMYIDNALGFDISIGTRWGTNFYSHSSYDIMGLQSPSTPGRFMFCWDGKADNGGRFPGGGNTYPVLIKIWNCNGVIDFATNITIMNDGTEHGSTGNVDNIVPTCLVLPNWPDYTEVIAGNELWDTNMAINGDVIVLPGASLTVNDNTLVMRPNTKIIVKKGGRLFLDNATLTSTIPGQPWGGIEIEGDPTASQASILNQGYANIYNSTLQHSKNTIAVGGGGILLCRSSQFLDNEGGNIAFGRYLSPVNAVNKSRIISNYFDGGDAPYIGLYWVKKVFIDNNEFNAGATSFPAISSREASYVITNNTFNNMPTGIADMSVVSGLNGSTIAYNTFNSGNVGAYIIGGSFMDINTNAFYDTHDYSLIVKNAQGFKITENNFQSFVQQATPVGVRIENSNPYGGELYKNTFTGYKVSSMTQSSNMALSIDCNTYDEYNNAIGVVSGSIKDQGLCLDFDPVTPVVNFFENGCEATSSQIAVNNNVPSFFYRTFNDAVPTNVTPIKVNIEVCAPIVSEQSCPSIHNISCNGDIPCQENILSRINGSTDPDEIRFLKNELLRDYINNNDTLENEPSKAKEYLGELTEDAMASKMLIAEAVYIGDYTDARLRITSLPENTDDDIAFKELYTILTDAYEENLTLEETYEAYPLQINEIAEVEGFAGGQARDIISFVNGTAFNIPLFELDPDVMSNCFEQQMNLRTKSNSSDESVTLGNTTPNPFSNQSEVACVIPHCTSAELVITDMVGRQMQVYPVSQGHTTVTINSNGLAEGIYFYSLKVDGNIVATKKLIISK